MLLRDGNNHAGTMTDQTPNLDLPYILAAQAQKHVTHNEALRLLDAVVQLTVLDRLLSAPPATPANGERYIIAGSPSGDWAGANPDTIAAYQDGAWTFLTPKPGWMSWVISEQALLVWTGSAWVAVSAGGGGGGPALNPVSGGLVGINATADSTNRLSLNAAAALFNHAGAGHQLKINKAANTDTASLLFQTGFSGRAEFGTAGDDDFRIKVSPDGTVWSEAIVVDRTSGSVSFPNTSFAASGGGVNPNVVVNGDFQINQRGFAGGALPAGGFGHDRWRASTGGANITVSGYVVTLASGAIEQVIEPAVWGVGSFASEAVTVSIEGPSADLDVTFGSQTGTITAGSGRRSVTLSLGGGDTGNLTFKIKAASAGSVSFGRVKAELAATASGWQARDGEAERKLCLRYFERQDVDDQFVSIICGRSATYATGVFVHAAKRAVPTITAPLSETYWDVVGVNSEVFTAAKPVFVPGKLVSSISVETTVNKFASAGGYLIQGKTGAYIDIDAEL